MGCKGDFRLQISDFILRFGCSAFGGLAFFMVRCYGT